MKVIATARPEGKDLEELFWYGKNAMAFSPDGTLLAVAYGPWYPTGGRQQIVLWDLSDPGAPRERARFAGKETVAFGSDRRLAFGREYEWLGFRDVATGEMSQVSLEAVEGRTWSDCVRRLAYAPSGRLAVALVRHLAIVEPSGAVIPLPLKHQATIDGIAWSRDEKHLYSLDTSYLRVWDVAAREQLKRLPLAGCWSMAIASDGSFLVLGGKHVALYPLTAKSPLPGKPRVVVKTSVSSLALQPGSRALAISTERDVRIVPLDKARAPKPVGHARNALGPSLAFSPDGTRLATVFDGTLTLYAL
jgi:WD40 repeat protein